MKFLVDAHLPPSLCAVLSAAGHDAIHTNQLTAHNQTPDEIINQLSLAEQRNVVTKDSDFSFAPAAREVFETAARPDGQHQNARMKA